MATTLDRKPEYLRDINTRLELMVDDYLIDRMDGARLQLQTPRQMPRAKSPLTGCYLKRQPSPNLRFAQVATPALIPEARRNLSRRQNERMFNRHESLFIHHVEQADVGDRVTPHDYQPIAAAAHQ